MWSGEGAVSQWARPDPTVKKKQQSCFGKFLNTMLHLRKLILSIYNVTKMSIRELSIFLCKRIYMFSYNYLIVTSITDVLRRWGANELSGP